MSLKSLVCLSVTLENKMEVIRKMKDGQTRLNMCKSVELLQSTVSSKMTSVRQDNTVYVTRYGSGKCDASELQRK